MTRSVEGDPSSRCARSASKVLVHLGPLDLGELQVPWLPAGTTQERTGADFTPEMLAFINEAINLESNCDGKGGSGPHAYVGLASSYFEEQTQNFERLDDDEWLTRFANHADVPWLQGLVSK